MSERQELFGFVSQDAAPLASTKRRSSAALQYHQESFALLGRKLPSVRDVAADLPASVAQWYALPDGLSLLGEYSNNDSPVAPEKFEYHTARKRTMATFLYENQGVCCWAFDLMGGDDPAVFVSVDCRPTQWTRCCSSFSKFVYTRLFDFRHWCRPAQCDRNRTPARRRHIARFANEMP